MRVASEAQQRRLSKELITTETHSEIAPFTHALTGSGGEEVKPSAMAHLPNLAAKIFEVLDQHARLEKKTRYY